MINLMLNLYKLLLNPLTTIWGYLDPYFNRHSSTLLKMGSLGDSFVGVLSTITNKASKECLILISMGVPYTPLGCSITPITFVQTEKEAIYPTI